MKVEASRMSSWERYQLDFMNDRVKGAVFQLRSVSRGRHIMHLREGNYHKGFHDKYGEVAYFRMFYYDPKEDIPTSYQQLIEAPPTESLSDSSISSKGSDISEENGWHVIKKEDKIPDTNPVVIRMEHEGYLEADPNGNVQFTKNIEQATKFQICQIPNGTAIAFFSRKHGKYLSLGGVFINKLMVVGSKFDNWEKFRMFYENDGIRCHLKVLKTWPPPTIHKCHLLESGDKTKAIFTLLYNDSKTI